MKVFFYRTILSRVAKIQFSCRKISRMIYPAKTTTKYRYALFSDNRIELFIDSKEKRKKLAEGKAKALSIHSFSIPLEKGDSSTRIWGDLHLLISLRHALNANSLEEAAKQIIYLHKIPLSSVAVYGAGNTAKMVINESCFRGEIGSPARLNFDKSCVPIYNQPKLYTVAKKKIPFSNIPILQIVAPEKLEAHRLTLFRDMPLPKYGPNTLSSLAEKYYDIARTVVP
uniref:hypothetical protein n=1 Tax=uncultured Pseudodesulfovibrio sp. TaxID=2035858 RepID=UPI0029C78138